MKIGFACKESAVCIHVNNKYLLLRHIFFCVLYILFTYFGGYSTSVLSCDIWEFLNPPSEYFYLEYTVIVLNDTDESDLEMNFTPGNYQDNYFVQNFTTVYLRF